MQKGSIPDDYSKVLKKLPIQNMDGKEVHPHTALQLRKKVHSVKKGSDAPLRNIAKILINFRISIREFEKHFIISATRSGRLRGEISSLNREKEIIRANKKHYALQKKETKKQIRKMLWHPIYLKKAS